MISSKREKISFYADKIYYFSLVFFMLALPFSRDLAGGFMFFAFLAWLGKLFLKEVHFDTSLLSTGILLMIIVISFSYLAYIGRFERDEMAGRILPYLLWFYVVSSVPITKERAGKILTVFFISMATAIIYCLTLHFKTPYTVSNRLFMYDDPNIYGHFIAMYFLLILTSIILEQKLLPKILKAFVLLPALTALLFTFSRGAWIGCLAGVIWLVFISLRTQPFRKIFTIILCLVILVSVVSLAKPD